MSSTYLRRRPAALLPVTLALLLAASAGTALAGGDIATLESPGPDAVASSVPDGATKDPQQAMLDFAACMREHGIDMPDPQFTADGRGMTISGEATSEDAGGDDGEEGPTLSGPMSDPEFQAANEACASLLEGAMPQMDPEQQAEAQAQALAFSQCMRDHGVDMPDPQFGSGPGGGMTIAIGGPGTDLDPRSPEFQAAQEACGGSFGFGPGSAPEGGPDGAVEPGASAAP